MKKIPTLFKRDESRRFVVDEVTPGCEWVLAGEGRATRKWDGTCVLIRRDGLAVHAFMRREVKPGKDAPANFVVADHDEVTGKTIGWEPADQSGFAGPLVEALIARPDITPGTYELCGPKINGNPEGLDRHVLVQHGADEFYATFRSRSFKSLRDWIGNPEFQYEGIVWHHPDGRMAKLKRRDFPASGQA